MADSWNKKEREKKKQQAKKEKEERKKERKEQSGSGMNGMMAYLDADGNLTSTPPDPSQRREVSLEEIEISVPRQTHEPGEPGKGCSPFSTRRVVSDSSATRRRGRASSCM
jgi:hypothetical protein